MFLQKDPKAKDTPQECKQQ